MNSTRGFALIDLLAACAVIGIVSAIAVPAHLATRDRDAARAAAIHLAKRLDATRVDALKRNVHVAMRFGADAPHAFGEFIDGDGDGVLQRDIDDGVDVAGGVAASLQDRFAGVAFRIARDVPDPAGGPDLPAGGDPVRLGASNLLSFSPLGSATSGTLYLAGSDGPQVCVRMFGATGRLRVLWFDEVTGTWRQD
jgi:type II secretory pathway pseudopilin PulG